MSKKQVNVYNTCEKLHQKYRKLNKHVQLTVDIQSSLFCIFGISDFHGIHGLRGYESGVSVRT